MGKLSKTELLDRLSRDSEERILLAKALDRAETAANRSIPTHTDFLSPGERLSVEALIAASGHPRHIFFGGYDGAERTVCMFLPDWQEDGDALENSPVSALHCEFPEDCRLSHRDFLGSVLGLGITREKTGDILVSDGSCDIVILPELTDFLLTNLVSAGRTPLKVREIPVSELTVPEKQVKIIRDTVAGLRLDAVMSSGFSISRTKAAELIGSGRVQLNYRDCVKSDKAVEQGDTISCRGLGKCRLAEVGGQSKKGRTVIVMERYI